MERRVGASRAKETSLPRALGVLPDGADVFALEGLHLTGFAHRTAPDDDFRAPKNRFRQFVVRSSDTIGKEQKRALRFPSLRHDRSVQFLEWSRTSPINEPDRVVLDEPAVRFSLGDFDLGQRKLNYLVVSAGFAENPVVVARTLRWIKETENGDCTSPGLSGRGSNEYFASNGNDKLAARNL